MKHRPSCLAAVLLIALSGPLYGQTPPLSEGPFKSSLRVASGAKVTRMRAETTLMLGGDVLLALESGWWVGGSGWALVEPLTLTGTTLGSDLTLDVAYAGIVLAHPLSMNDEQGVAVRVLVGAGNAKVSIPVAATEIAADNFGVIEPEVIGHLVLSRLLTLEGRAGYRVVYGVEDLPQVTGNHLRGASITLGISLGPF